MSKLGRTLKAHQTDQRFHEVDKIDYLDVRHTSAPAGFDHCTEFRLEALFGTTFFVSEQARCDMGSDVVIDAARLARAAIIEEIFGEFRPLITKARQRAGARDWKGADDALSALYNHMFDDGIN